MVRGSSAIIFSFVFRAFRPLLSVEILFFETLLMRKLYYRKRLQMKDRQLMQSLDTKIHYTHNKGAVPIYIYIYGYNMFGNWLRQYTVQSGTIPY